MGRMASTAGVGTIAPSRSTLSWCACTPGACATLTMDMPHARSMVYARSCGKDTSHEDTDAREQLLC